MGTTKNAKYTKRLVIVRSAEQVNTITHDFQSFRLFLLRHQQKPSFRFLERPEKTLDRYGYYCFCVFGVFRSESTGVQKFMNNSGKNSRDVISLFSN